jgi:hypothetical protein
MKLIGLPNTLLEIVEINNTGVNNENNTLLEIVEINKL